MTLRSDTPEAALPPSPGPRRPFLDRLFDVGGRGSTLGREIRGGVTTFVAMSYVILLNPLVLGATTDVTGARLTTEQVTTATALAAAVMTVLMGLVGNAPLAVAAGLGVNGVVAFQMAPTMTWPQAFGLVVVEGVCIVLMAVSGVRERVINAIPAPLKTAITVGIGLYIALVGLVSAGFVTRTPDAARSTVPVRMGADGHLQGWPVLVFCVGLLLMVVLVARRTPGAVLISIVAATLLAVGLNLALDIPDWGLVEPRVPDHLVGAPDFSLLGRVDLLGGFASAGAIAATVFLFTLVLSGFFDAMGTITSVAAEARMTDADGRVPGMGRILVVDGAGAVVGGLTGSSPNTVFLESAAGVGEGARTGLASVVTGLLFGLTLLFTPLAAVVPAQAAAPALVVVGGMMVAQCRSIPWQDPDYTIPVFLTAAVIPFTYSITNGVGAGLVSFVLVKTFRGRWREAGWTLTAIALLFAAYFAVEPIETLLKGC
ncbi:putative MFS transporter, AGZA family, xanthine/uracil permease [Streptoalloteichus tenebrarius]|uniref:MFS transporter, AGZA family, xanthine/uracil permease n=1 Tax=Streptoalloteichus tenebrarius (strain ATCC 17920 / DSM 40477 / JCM 4838 / CBS 697.72 / NBRC 16177 / NCIMB 11028 / NRRL B-12390 / A12253. 1 / ISP 5477) TaxID=1933 RepID=A0ABT1I1V0_STRSD|nr:putative MFS transporter, AGZA family, xanthine/uracil permease [Streptoalloteichus tenebrarius]